MSRLSGSFVLQANAVALSTHRVKARAIDAHASGLRIEHEPCATGASPLAAALSAAWALWPSDVFLYALIPQPPRQQDHIQPDPYQNTGATRKLPGVPYLSSGQRERIFDVLARQRVAIAPDADHVETRHPVLETMALNIVLGGARNLSLLAVVDRIERADQRAALTRLHLDEHEHPMIEGDQIHLAEAATIIAREDDVPLSAQVLFSGSFAMYTERLSMIKNGVPRVERVQTLC
jgi:hypothetical protein